MSFSYVCSVFITSLCPHWMQNFSGYSSDNMFDSSHHIIIFKFTSNLRSFGNFSCAFLGFSETSLITATGLD